MTTAAWRSLPAAVVVCLAPAGPALAHSEGLTPYRYVQAPPGVSSEGAAGAGLSTQPLGAAAFAGTTDNQMQLTLPPGALPVRPGERVGLTAPAAPSEVYELVDGAWQPVSYVPVAGEEGFSSVVALRRPGTFLQADDPSTAPPSAAPSAEASRAPAVAAAGGGVVLTAAVVLLRRCLRTTDREAQPAVPGPRT